MVQLADKQSMPRVDRPDSALRKQDSGLFNMDDVPASPDNPSKQQLANELASELWARLPISRVGFESGNHGIEHVIRIATASSTQISTWYQELRDFASAIAKAATEVRGDETTDAFRKELSEDVERQIREQIRYPLPNRSFVDFRFAELHPVDAWTHAHGLLEHACLEFSNQVFALLDQLQQQEVVGEIQQTSTTCRFSFFRRVAILTNTMRKTETRMRRNPGFQLPSHTVWLRETFQISNLEILHRHAQYVHHVRNPVLSDPSETEYPLPPKYVRLVDSCPDWLTGSLRVLEGELFREERIEWDLHSETRTDEKVIERVLRCPAVVFGPYVLAGWGEPAIAEEEHRLHDIQVAAERTVSASTARLTHIVTFLVAGSAIAAILFTGSATAVITSLAVLLGFVAMVVAGYGAHLASVARGRLSAGRVLRHSTQIGASVFAAQGLLFSVLHWSLPALAMGVVAAAIAVIAISLKSADKELDGFSVG